MVVAFGAIGILLARIVPSVIAAPLLVVALIALQLAGPGRWRVARRWPLSDDDRPVRVRSRRDL